jgi:hypothetical protein
MSERRLLGDQPKAYEEIRMFLLLGGGGMYLLQGYAGTGKTFMLSEIVELLSKKGRILVTAPTHKAVKVLRDMIKDCPVSMTTHAALGMKQVIKDDGTIAFKPDHSLGFPAEDFTHIIVDEASMINDELFDVMVPLSERGKKILFVGDPLQIPPVGQEYSLPFNKDVRKQHGIEVSSLNTIIRQAEGNPIIENASSIRARVYAPVQILNSQEVKNHLGGVFPIKKADEPPYFLEKILPMFKSPSYERSIDYIKVVGWRNSTIDAYNKIIREYIFGQGIPKIIVGDKLIADAPIMEKGKTIISTNDEMEVLSTEVQKEELNKKYTLHYYWTKVRVYTESIYNEYMIRIIHEDSMGIFKEICQMFIDVATKSPKGSYQSRSTWIDYYKFLEHWHQVKYSYAITAHKAQGSTYENAYVLKWDIETNLNVYERNRILYTACTRPSKNLYIVY